MLRQRHAAISDPTAVDVGAHPLHDERLRGVRIMHVPLRGRRTIRGIKDEVMFLAYAAPTLKPPGVGMPCSNHHVGMHRGCLACEWHDANETRMAEAEYLEKQRQKHADRLHADTRKRLEKRDRSARQQQAQRPPSPADAKVDGFVYGVLVGVPVAALVAVSVAMFFAGVLFAVAPVLAVAAVVLLALSVLGKWPDRLPRIAPVHLAQVVAIGVLGIVGGRQEATTQILGFGPKFSAGILVTAALMGVWITLLGRALLGAWRARTQEAVAPATPPEATV